MNSDSHTNVPSGSGAPGSEMPHPVLGRTGRPVSIISLGTWQLGADWGEVRPDDALAVLEAAAQAGVTMFDTADVYGDGRSEQCIAEFLAAHPGLDTFVATKTGREPTRAWGLLMANFRAWTDRSRSTCAPTPSTSSSCTAPRPKSSTATGCSATSTRSWPRE